MARKTIDEPITIEDIVTSAQTIAQELSPTIEGTNSALVSLQLSDIITIADGTITWRTGHLEHIANLYAGDPVTTERNYADDLAVARAYSAETWAALLEASK